MGSSLNRQARSPNTAFQHDRLRRTSSGLFPSDTHILSIGMLRMCVCGVLLVEMGGVEPPSRKVSRRFTTSLVNCLLSLAVTHLTRRPLSQPTYLSPA